MVFNVDIRNQGVTSNQVTAVLEVDEATCFLIAQVFQDLGAALSRARIGYKAARRWKATEDQRKAAQERLRTDIAATMRGLAGLPANQIVSGVARAHGLKWDSAAIHVKEIRQAERRKAALERDREIMRLSKSGLTAGAIAKRLHLSAGSVRNILSRRKKASEPPEAAESTAYRLSAVL